MFLPTSAAHANAGVPMVGIFLPPMWFALIPIVALEAFIIGQVVGAPWRPILLGTAIANVASTIVGVPIVWTVLATIEMKFFGNALGLGTFWTKLYAVTVQAPWLIPYDEALHWMLPTALAVLAVPFYLVSIFVEAPIIGKLCGISSAPNLKKAVWTSNLASYAGLGLLVAIGFYLDWRTLSYLGPMQPVVDAILSLMDRVAALLSPRP